MLVAVFIVNFIVTVTIVFELLAYPYPVRYLFLSFRIRIGDAIPSSVSMYIQRKLYIESDSSTFSFITDPLHNVLSVLKFFILLFNCTRNTSWRFYPPRSKNYEYDIYSPSKALHVFFPTIPSALSPCALWNAITAASVPVPKIPSTLPQLNPRLFNLS